MEVEVWGRSGDRVLWPWGFETGPCEDVGHVVTMCSPECGDNGFEDVSDDEGIVGIEWRQGDTGSGFVGVHRFLPWGAVLIFGWG